ncbi:MAG: hypothetical protein H0V18_16585 [Pyrinomonadaceae bacterium]|nr:hypothetical protein [Pyrinomonadaceae bacterium]
MGANPPDETAVLRASRELYDGAQGEASGLASIPAEDEIGGPGTTKALYWTKL